MRPPEVLGNTPSLSSLSRAIVSILDVMDPFGDTVTIAGFPFSMILTIWRPREYLAFYNLFSYTNLLIKWLFCPVIVSKSSHKVEFFDSIDDDKHNRISSARCQTHEYEPMA